MTDLKTTFAGLSLRNPIIISSSGLTNSAGKNKRLAEAGAGAIVLKSLFEEQIMLEADQLKDPAFYPEASDYLEEYIREHKLAEYLTLIKESKKECNIPIIASINCYSDAEWIDFAKQIQEAGADALEINILALQSDVQYTYGSFEQRHIDILRHIKRTVSIPVIMKSGNSCVSRRKNLFWRLSGRGSISRSPSGIPGWIKRLIMFSTGVIQRRPIWRMGTAALPTISARMQSVHLQ